MPDRSFLAWPFFDDSHRQLADAISKWAKREISGEVSEAVDQQCREFLSSLASGGWLRYVVPKQYGGATESLDARSVCLIRDALAYHSGLAEFSFAMQGLGSAPITLFGSEELKRKYLPKVAAGEAIAAFAISEAEAGSDLRAMQTTARRDGDHYVIDGKKNWISNAGIADFYVTYCRFPEAGEKAFVALLVEASAQGIAVSERIEVIAPHVLGNVTFHECRVPASALIGREGDGLKIALGTLDIFRASVGAAALGFARRALDEAVCFARERRQFGQALSDFQITQAKFADMAVVVDTSALLVYRAAWTRDVLMQPVTREAAMAKLYATESAQRVIDEAVQILGARGVIAGSITERLYREIRALRIYEGASEIQKLIIAGQILKAAAAGDEHAR